mmetsp:Transcript_22744/g.57590  ORF Transcript_22744/g.57590 Transcript_22744/m.57590 type:complete len:192 (-) Transcript_22744:871-1446(-)|eukprot:CAMPEP_0178988516 /NCGR_PEP_ID=MMETSP0795-20121207/3851_1 /TAXON_ID=88552 /ORGANISM="Amoebophrya sp., Strain Ameob2" /LENGTH=191 /DNA_ID=CAMNT_0020679793 /DNA_START=234 /DNA_END=809 /DNA_ORIENTATION=-
MVLTPTSTDSRVQRIPVGRGVGSNGPLMPPGMPSLQPSAAGAGPQSATTTSAATTSSCAPAPSRVPNTLAGSCCAGGLPGPPLAGEGAGQGQPGARDPTANGTVFVSTSKCMKVRDSTSAIGRMAQEYWRKENELERARGTRSMNMENKSGDGFSTSFQHGSAGGGPPGATHGGGGLHNHAGGHNFYSTRK